MRSIIAGMVLGSLSLIGTPAVAAPPGTMYFDQSSVELKGDWESKVKKGNLKQLEKQENGEWSVFVVAFLKKAPGAKEIAVLFYDTADKAGGDPNGVMEVNVTPSTKVLATTLSFGDDAGLKAGHSYNVVIARKINGKDEVYARGAIALK